MKDDLIKVTWVDSSALPQDKVWHVAADVRQDAENYFTTCVTIGKEIHQTADFIIVASSFVEEDEGHDELINGVSIIPRVAIKEIVDLLEDLPEDI